MYEYNQRVTNESEKKIINEVKRTYKSEWKREQEVMKKKSNENDWKRN